MSQLKITLTRSPIGMVKKHQATLEALGLRRLHQSRTLTATPQVMGMVRQINYLLDIEEIG